jgi:hypothetical protein
MARSFTRKGTLLLAMPALALVAWVGSTANAHAAVAVREAESPSLAVPFYAEATEADAGARAGVSEPPLAKRKLAGCQPEFGSFATGNWPSACWRPYGPSSPFNVPIPANPVLSPESTAIIRYMTKRHWAFESNERGGNFTWDNRGSRPVYWPKSSDPLVKVTCRGGAPCQPGMQLHIPAGARPEEQSDAHMTIVEQKAGLEYDFWRATKPANGQMTVSAGNSIPIGAGSGTGLGGYASASYLGLLGGTVRASELAAGKIEHALTTTVQCVQSQDVWPSPASGTGDSICRRHRAGPHLSNLLQLNMSEAEIAATGAPPWQRTIMQAMAHYGVYVVDTNGSHETAMRIFAEDDLSFTSFGYPGQMNEFVRSAGGVNGMLTGVHIDVSKLRVIAPCVPERTC